MATNTIMLLELKNGVAEFPFPRALKIDNNKSNISCHALITTSRENRVGFIVSNASYYRVNESKGYKFNILETFDCTSQMGNKIHKFNGKLKAPLNRIHESIQVYTMDEHYKLMDMDGFLIIELSGAVQIGALI